MAFLCAGLSGVGFALLGGAMVFWERGKGVNARGARRHAALPNSVRIKCLLVYLISEQSIKV
jgi:hypothetical protein